MRPKLLVLASLSIAFFVLLATFPKSIFQSSPNPIDPSSLTGEYDKNDTKGIYLSSNVESKEINTKTKVLGSNSANKRIEVDLTNQRLYAYENGQKVYDFLISSGKWGRTPTGVFTIWGKFRYTKMEGGNKALHTYYYLPNVPYVMFFENDEVPASRGFSLHGTYWHENFGHPMSHGCVNMKTEEAAIIYNWCHPNLGEKRSGRASEEDPGTNVIIYGEAPKS